MSNKKAKMIKTMTRILCAFLALLMVAGIAYYAVLMFL